MRSERPPSWKVWWTATRSHALTASFCPCLVSFATDRPRNEHQLTEPRWMGPKEELPRRVPTPCWFVRVASVLNGINVVRSGKCLFGHNACSANGLRPNTPKRQLLALTTRVCWLGLEPTNANRSHALFVSCLVVGIILRQRHAGHTRDFRKVSALSR